jgi:hypothetical protein
MIDLRTEQPISLAEAARGVPAGRNGKRTHLSTILRWILQGAKGPGGVRVKLEGLRLGGRWMTSREALQRFAEALTPDLAGKPPRPPRSPAARERALRKADAELAKIGI